MDTASIQLWVLGATNALLFILVSYLAKSTIYEITKKIDLAIEELKTLSKHHSSQEERIKYLHESQLEMSLRMNAHTERLFRLESVLKNN